MSVADQDPPSIPVGVRPPQASLEDRSGQQLVQWLSVQADHMAGSLQQNARALMVRASSPIRQRPPGVDPACADCPGFLVLGAAPAPASTFVSEPQIVPLG